MNRSALVEMVVVDPETKRKRVGPFMIIDRRTSSKVESEFPARKPGRSIVVEPCWDTQGERLRAASISAEPWRERRRGRALTH